MNIYYVDKYMVFRDERIGKGAFGEVFKGSYQPGKGPENLFMAVKLVEVPQQLDHSLSDEVNESLESLKQEIQTLRTLKHPNIVRLYDVKKLDNKIFIFMEFCNQGDLKKFFEKQDPSEGEILFYFSQVINGFKHLRKKNIIHRDVKPENILVNNGIIKIADFGFAKTGRGETFTSMKGTPMTMSPQVLEGEGYSDKADIYSLGVTLYYLFFKKFPFNAKNIIQLVDKLKISTLPEFPPNCRISEESKKLIINMLKYEEKDRIEWEDLFNHPLLKLDNYLDSLNILGGDALNAEGEESVPIDIDFDFNASKTDLGFEDKQILENAGKDFLNRWNDKVKIDGIAFKIVKRITFEKGIAMFIRRLYNRVTDFIRDRSNFSFHAPDEILIIVKFLLSKFELMLINELKTVMDNKSELLDITYDEWEAFSNHEEYERIKKFIEIDFKTHEVQIFHRCLEEIEKIQKAHTKYNSLNTNESLKNLLQSKVFTVNLENVTEFKSMFAQIVIEFLRYFKDQMNSVRIATYASFPRNELKDIIFMLDDFFIIICLDDVFTWDESKPINFNKFFQDRADYYQQDDKVVIIKERLILAYEHLIH